jgi:hypothetical protein
MTLAMRMRTQGGSLGWPGLLLVVFLLGAGWPAGVALGVEDEARLDLHCRFGRGDHAAMETHYVERFCWAHLGAHHYFPGVESVYALRAGTGVVFSVEQQLSPPTEPGDLHIVPPQINSTLAVETSMDGVSWVEVAGVQYRLYRILPFGILADLRQEIPFSFTLDEEQEFRFLRVRQPVSAMQGLSGFLDHSELSLDVRVVGPVPEETLAPGRLELSCAEDIMEAFFFTHPCTYGGLNRYDAPSFFHTYPLGGVARVEAIDLRATAAYWRPDDPGFGHGQSLAGMLSGDLLVLASLDGTVWWELGRFPISYGESLDAALETGGATMAFVRVATGKHPGYTGHPALKRAEGYLLESALGFTVLQPEP